MLRRRRAAGCLDRLLEGDGYLVRVNIGQGESFGAPQERQDLVVEDVLDGGGQSGADEGQGSAFAEGVLDNLGDLA